MGTYDTARNKTKTAIIESFWKLYCKKDVSKITVKDITEATGIHRATFYLYYDNVFAILDAIKNEQLEKLKYVCSTYTSIDNDYADFLKAMRRLYDENETYLEPLLCQYRGNEFAVQYRQVMKSKLRTDIGPFLLKVLIGLLRKVWTTLLLRLWNESLELLSTHLPNKTYTSFLF